MRWVILRIGASSAADWWLRSALSGTPFRGVSSHGGDDTYGAYSSRGVALGFCPASQSNRKRRNLCVRIEGENNPRRSVNIYSDGQERTLLAWQCLMVMRCFMLLPYAAICNHPEAVRSIRET